MGKRGVNIIKNKRTSSNRPARRFEEKRKKEGGFWALKVTIATFLTTAIFTFLSDATVTNSSIIVASLIVFFLILISIIFDVVGVAVTSCDISSLLPMSKRGVKESKIAISLVKNASKVSSVCSDVVGDICSIISGACGTVIVAKILLFVGINHEFVLTISISSLLAGITVGGKAFGKKFAINYSKQIVIMTAKVLSMFAIKRKKESKSCEKRNKKRR